jgi:hypothetical protein
MALRYPSENVEERAADREIAGLRYLRHARVAGTGQAQAECLEVEFLADAQAQRVAVDKVSRWQALQCGRQVTITMPRFRVGRRAIARSRCEMMSGCGENWS